MTMMSESDESVDNPYEALTGQKAQRRQLLPQACWWTFEVLLALSIGPVLCLRLYIDVTSDDQAQWAVNLFSGPQLLIWLLLPGTIATGMRIAWLRTGDMKSQRDRRDSGN